jgi:hypothetical protein
VVTRNPVHFGVGSVETGVNLPEVPQPIREALETLKRRQEAYLSNPTADTVDGLYHFVRRTFERQVGISPEFIAQVLKGEMMLSTLEMIVRSYGDMLDQTSLEAAFRTVSSYSVDCNYFPGLIERIGELSFEKGVQLSPENSFGRAFTPHEEYTESDVKVLKYVLQGLSPKHGELFINATLQRAIGLEVSLKEYWSSVLAAGAPEEGKYLDVGNKFQGASLVPEALKALSEKGASGIVSRDTIQSWLDSGHAKPTDIYPYLNVLSAEARALIEAECPQAAVAKEPVVAPVKKPSTILERIRSLF